MLYRRKNGDYFDCRSLQIRWFLSDWLTQCWLAVWRQSPFLLAMTSLDDRWHLLDGKWEMGKLDLGRQDKENKNKKFLLSQPCSWLFLKAIFAWEEFYFAQLSKALWNSSGQKKKKEKIRREITQAHILCN